MREELHSRNAISVTRIPWALVALYSQWSDDQFYRRAVYLLSPTWDEQVAQHV